MNLEEFPLCPTCKTNHRKPSKDTSGNFILSSYCSVECSNGDFETRSSIGKKIQANVDQVAADEKRKQTMIEKYGVAYNGQRAEVKESLSKLNCKTCYNTPKVLPKINMTPYDITALDEIKEFLIEQKIPFETEYDNFCLNFGTPNSFEIEYVNSFAHAMAQPKYGLKGVGLDYFYTQSKKAEEQESFKFWVKDYEWNDPHKREILKSYILHAAGRTPNRVYARDTEVKVFTNKDLKQFQIENCFYGFRAASLCLGLVLKKKVGDLEPGTLLMVTTFGKNFFGKKEGLVEVFRVGTLKNTQVIGGSSKLFKHFIRNHPFLKIGEKLVPYSKVIYYVDYDHGAGKSLSKIGFTFQRDSGGGFMNIDTRTGLPSHRKPMQHKQVMEQVARGEVIPVPNAGVKVYEYIVEEPAKLAEPVIESTLEKFF